MSKFLYQVFSPQAKDLLSPNVRNASFGLYQDMWQEEFQAIYGAEHKLFSDAFTKQDLIQSIFFEGQCVALNGLKSVDLNSDIDRKDSWFANWIEMDFEAISKYSHNMKVTVNSLFTVHRDYRKAKRRVEPSIGVLLGSLTCLYQLEKNLGPMIGMMRKSRSMDKLGDFLGATVIRENVSQHGDASNIIIFDISRTIDASRNYPTLAHEMYENYASKSNNRDCHEHTT